MKKLSNRTVANCAGSPSSSLDQVFGPLADLAGNEVEIRFGVMPHECRDGVVGPPLLGQFAPLELLEGSVKSCLARPHRRQQPAGLGRQ